MVLRIFKIIATIGFLTALKCTKFVFGQPHWGSLRRSPDPLAGLRGPTSKGERGRLKKGKGEKKVKGMKRGDPPFSNSWIRPGGGIIGCIASRVSSLSPNANSRDKIV